MLNYFAPLTSQSDKLEQLHTITVKPANHTRPILGGPLSKQQNQALPPTLLWKEDKCRTNWISFALPHMHTDKNSANWRRTQAAQKDET